MYIYESINIYIYTLVLAVQTDCPPPVEFLILLLVKFKVIEKKELNR